jgi:DNA-directed RNA polymerase specialized sigma24 family protein
MNRASIDVARCQELIASALGGDEASRRRLIEVLWPVWTHIVSRNRSMGSLAASEDHVQNVVGKLVEKLSRSDGHKLRQYVEWQKVNHDRTFEDWIRIVTKNAIRDYVRRQFPAPAKGRCTPKRLMNELATSPLVEELGVRPAFTAGQTARELLEFAESQLSPNQMEALRLWLDGAVFEEIAEHGGVSPDDARKLVRAGVMILRRRFGTSGEEP